MKLRSEITIPQYDFQLTHRDKIQMMGSCFTENISDSLQKSGFQIDTNPFGIVYNPLSLSTGIHELIDNKKYTVHDLFQHNGLYHSWMHHSRFSSSDSETVASQINQRINESSSFLKNAQVLIITWGTASVYTLQATGTIVSNCHQLPEKNFHRHRLSVEDISVEWGNLISKLKQYNPSLKIILTISPIRHWKDGAHENQLSKSILLLAADALIQKHPDCYYFPSYELLLDDLRDYRFYAEDLFHPSPLAIHYIWEKFSLAFFNADTIRLISEWKSILDALNHKPFQPQSQTYSDFWEKTKQRLNDFCTLHPEFTPNIPNLNPKS